MDIQVTNSKLVPKSEISELMQKVKHDLSFGVKIRGNESNRNDVIRVWTSSESEVFGLIATSSSRFNGSINFIEIQSFQQKPYIKLSLINKSRTMESDEIEVKFTLLNENFFELTEKVEEKLIDGFIKQYLLSKPDSELTKINFEKYYYNRSQYEWLQGFQK